jgi:hypothetical protein
VQHLHAEASPKKKSLCTDEVVIKGLEQKVDVEGMLDQILEEGDETVADSMTRFAHIQVGDTLARARHCSTVA